MESDWIDTKAITIILGKLWIHRWILIDLPKDLWRVILRPLGIFKADDDINTQKQLSNDSRSQ